MELCSIKNNRLKFNLNFFFRKSNDKKSINKDKKNEYSRPCKIINLNKETVLFKKLFAGC